MIIGITGTLCAGKSMVIELLKEKGFRHHSVSGYLREILEKRNVPVSRDTLVALGNELREKHFPGYVVDRVYERAAKDGGDCIIESIRTVGEIETLKKKGPFVLIAVDAKQRVRYKRSVARQSEKDRKSFRQFKADEEREMTSGDPNKQNLSACIARADYRIDNSGTLEEFKEKIMEIIRQIRK